MAKKFNTTGVCRADVHYMVDITDKLVEIKKMIDAGNYFTINRARQYGKTTTLQSLEDFLANEYVVVSLDFQRLGYASFETEQMFVEAFASELLTYVDDLPEKIETGLENFTFENLQRCTFQRLFRVLNNWCKISEKPIVLMIDEVDSASNNQVFLDFLSLLRGYYITRAKIPTFHSVILASVYDIKNLKRKIRPEEEHKVNSPWNIAADFTVDMSFSENQIETMLMQYEEDYHTSMNIKEIAKLLYDYTSGYPFLVSRLCKLMDEVVFGTNHFKTKEEVWTKAGFLEAIKLILMEKNTLFDSLFGKLETYPELNDMIRDLLFTGKTIGYNIYNPIIDIAVMFGFIKNKNGTMVVANRIFETCLYNFYLSNDEIKKEAIYRASLLDKNNFVENGYLNMKLVLERFVVHFNDLYQGCSTTFLEEEGRRRFLLYLRPIINGVGNYYVEARTRNSKRTDVIIDYAGEQYIIEMKIWHGNEYNSRGEQQLVEYLDYYHQNKGYMISFNFNQNKEIGVKEIVVGDKVLIEAVV